MAKRTKSKQIKKSVWDIALIAILMILLGIAELVTGLTHHFLGIFTAADVSSTYLAFIIGVLYIVSGLLVLTIKKQSAMLAMICLAIVVVVRIAMALTGLYLTVLSSNHLFRTAAILIDTAIAVIFTIYIWLKLNDFR